MTQYYGIKTNNKNPSISERWTDVLRIRQYDAY